MKKLAIGLAIALAFVLGFAVHGVADRCAQRCGSHGGHAAMCQRHGGDHGCGRHAMCGRHGSECCGKGASCEKECCKKDSASAGDSTEITAGGAEKKACCKKGEHEHK